MIPTLTPTEFARLINSESRPILAGCLENDTLHDEQLGVLSHIERAFSQQFSVCLMDPDYRSEFDRTYAIAGTPSYLLFYQGEEKTRFLGYADALNLMNILLVDDYSELDHLQPSQGQQLEAHPVPNLSGLFRDWTRR